MIYICIIHGVGISLGVVVVCILPQGPIGLGAYTTWDMYVDPGQGRKGGDGVRGGGGGLSIYQVDIGRGEF